MLAILPEEGSDFPGILLKLFCFGLTVFGFGKGPEGGKEGEPFRGFEVPLGVSLSLSRSRSRSSFIFLFGEEVEERSFLC